MSKVLSVKYNKKPCYDICIEKNFKQLSAKISEVFEGERKCCIITDSTVGKLYADTVKEAVKDNFAAVEVFTFKAGEDSKNMDTVGLGLEFLLKHKFNRKDIILALGGGVVGDTAGFISSIYMRGIEFIQVPTSLLACVDSSVGGKTGVDFNGYKNIVGAFKMPKLVYINTSVLSSLTARQYYSGMGEVLKYGLIMDSKFYEWILDNMYGIFDLKSDVLEEMIEKSCACKQKVVEADPLEAGLRKTLNFGHTIGHAIEKHMDFKLLHGECVALGMVCAAHISWKRGMISMDDFYEIRDMMVPFNLPITITGMDPKEVVKLTKSDKKNDNSSKKAKFVLLSKVGKSVYDEEVSDKEMLDALEQINVTEEDLKA